MTYMDSLNFKGQRKSGFTQLHQFINDETEILYLGTRGN